MFLGMVMYANEFKTKEKQINWNKKITATYIYVDSSLLFSSGMGKRVTF